MDRWLHETMDWFCLGESIPYIHKFKDSASRSPTTKWRHRAVRHSEWREWSTLWGIDAHSPGDVLENSAKRFLGVYANMPTELVPKDVHKAYMEFGISVAHEMLDEMWDTFDQELRSHFELFWALYLLQDDKWDEDILNDSRFMELQDYVLWGVLVGYYRILQETNLGKEIVDVAENHIQLRGSMRDKPYELVAERTSKKFLRVLKINEQKKS